MQLTCSFGSPKAFWISCQHDASFCVSAQLRPLEQIRESILWAHCQLLRCIHQAINEQVSAQLQASNLVGFPPVFTDLLQGLFELIFTRLLVT